MQLYAAIDLHSKSSVLAVIDEQDALQLWRKLPNDIAAIRQALERFRDQLVGVVVESGLGFGSCLLLAGMRKGNRRDLTPSSANSFVR